MLDYFLQFAITCSVLEDTWVVRRLEANAWVEPALVEGLGEGPFGLDFDLGSPDELSVDVVGEAVHHALSELHDLLVGVVFRVGVALAAVWGAKISATSEWSEDEGLTVEVWGEALIEVWLGAVNKTASVGVWVSVVVEAIEPVGASIGGQGPLSSEDWVLDILGHGKLVLVPAAVIHNISAEWGTEGDVWMEIVDHIFHIVIWEEIVPGLASGVVRIMEDELGVVLVGSEELSDLSVVDVEDIKSSAEEWLVDWLKSPESVVLS